MSNSIVANRYALALFKAAQAKGEVEAVQQQLLEIKKIFVESAELKVLLETPRLSNTKKKELLSQLLNGANQLILNTVYVLLDKKRMDEIINLVDEYIIVANDAAGIADAKVYSTQALTADEEASISTAFAAKVGKQSLRIENIIDESLIGGVRVQIGNRIFDSSLSGKLNRLKKDLIRS